MCVCVCEVLTKPSGFTFTYVYVCVGVFSRCRRQLRKNMFYPEYVDMETEVLVAQMEEEMRKFLDVDLPCHIVTAFSSMCAYHYHHQ